MMQKMMADIEEVVNMMTEMGSLTLSMLEESIESIDREDPELTERTRLSRIRIIELDEAIESKAFRILMIYQPMSGDMRLVATILKMTTYFERLGKYGYNISRYSINVKGSGRPCFNRISEMGRIALKMISGVIDAFITKDISGLEQYSELEDRLDALRKKMLQETIQFMKNNPDRIDDGNKIITVTRYLERTGDYACKLAEKIIFMVSGERVDIG